MVHLLEGSQTRPMCAKKSSVQIAKFNENVHDVVGKDCKKEEDENEVHADYQKYNGKKHDRYVSCIGACPLKWSPQF